jgi:HK97 family phage prohead protease
MTTAAAMGLKEYAYVFETKGVEDSGVFEGYASTFGNVDQGGDVVQPGAFMEGIVKARSDRRVIPMLWQHDQREPIGVWEDIAEDAKGLYVKGRLLLADDPLARRAHGLLKNKAIGGMSIGYRIPAGGIEMDEKKPGVAKLKKIDLREISLVTMPMNIQARVTSVKSILESGREPTVREFEDHLRDVCGFSKSKAVAMASACASILRGEPEGKALDATAYLRAFTSALG